MAANCHRNKQELRFLRQVDPAIWKACAGTSVQIPAVGARVYYFPQGHMEHLSSTSLQFAISALSHLPPTPLVLCRVIQVMFLSDPDTDEVYARIRMEPLLNSEFFLAQPPKGNSAASAVVGLRMAVMDGGYGEGEGRREEDGAVVSFAKVLTPSDANNGGGFSVPRFCADSIFPPLDYKADPPVQTVNITDVRGESWSFRHIYRGTPRRHLLTTGWSKFVNSKKLIAGDSVVFMKNKNSGKLFVGVRRFEKAVSSADMSKWTMQCGALAGTSKMMRPDAGEEARFSMNGGRGPVAEVLELVANSKPFEVVYYPKAGSRDFVVAAEKVEAAMAVHWTAGMRIKMAMDTEDSSRMTWFQGTVSSTSVPEYGPWQRSPWRMLQVAWDEPGVLENIKRVSPWQVEVLSPAQAIDAAYPQAKRFKFSQNYGLFTNGGAEIPLPRMGLSSSMIGHLSTSPHLNYNIFPAGIQGARQDNYYIPSLANTVNDRTRKVRHVSSAENNPIQKAEAVSTDLNIASSQSDTVSPDTSSGVLSSSPEAAVTAAGSSAPKSFILFGQIIHADGQGENPDRVNHGTEEGERPRNTLDLSLSDPCMNLLWTAAAAEADPS